MLLPHLHLCCWKTTLLLPTQLVGENDDKHGNSNRTEGKTIETQWLLTQPACPRICN